MTRDEVLDLLERLAFERDHAADECDMPWRVRIYQAECELFRAAAELIRAGGWRPIAEAPEGQALILVGRWHRGEWNWKITWFAGQAMEDGYTHYLPEPVPPAREVPNDRG